MADKKYELQVIQQLSFRMRRKALDMAFKVGNKGAHLGGGLSAIEILACLYGGIMHIDPKNPQMKDRDIFIASKAHCVLALYTALSYSGFFPENELDTFEENESELSGHPVINVKKGIEMSGGSLGMGLSQGVGISLASARLGIDNHVFVLLGDGECDEGSIWEAAMSAANFEVDRLIAIVDWNKLQYDGSTEKVMKLVDLKNKFFSFGFEVFEADGHDVKTLYEAFSKAKASKNGKPKVIIADTIKGKGISFMEGKPEWHHGVLSKEQYEKAMLELEAGEQHGC